MVNNINSVSFGTGPVTPSSPNGYTMSPDPFIKLETPPDSTELSTAPAPEKKKNPIIKGLLVTLIAVGALFSLSLCASGLSGLLKESQKAPEFIKTGLKYAGKLWEKTAELAIAGWNRIFNRPPKA